MIVHGARPSPFARKVLVALEEKRVPYEQRDLVPVPKTPALMAMHPMGKVPILELDDGSFVPDSSVICLYLERVHPDPALYPADPVQYARALFLEEYADTKLIEVIGGVFFERFVKPNVLRQDPDEGRVRSLLATDVPPALDYLEAQVPESRATIFDRFCIADIALGAHLGGLRLAGEAIDVDRWPRLARYTKAVWSRPSFQRALAS